MSDHAAQLVREQLAAFTYARFGVHAAAYKAADILLSLSSAPTEDELVRAQAELDCLSDRFGWISSKRPLIAEFRRDLASVMATSSSEVLQLDAKQQAERQHRYDLLHHQKRLHDLSNGGFDHFPPSERLVLQRRSRQVVENPTQYYGFRSVDLENTEYLAELDKFWLMQKDVVETERLCDESPSP